MPGKRPKEERERSHELFSLRTRLGEKGKGGSEKSPSAIAFPNRDTSRTTLYPAAMWENAFMHAGGRPETFVFLEFVLRL